MFESPSQVGKLATGKNFISFAQDTVASTATRLWETILFNCKIEFRELLFPKLVKGEIILLSEETIII